MWAPSTLEKVLATKSGDGGEFSLPAPVPEPGHVTSPAAALRLATPLAPWFSALQTWTELYNLGLQPTEGRSWDFSALKTAGVIPHNKFQSLSF